MRGKVKTKENNKGTVFLHSFLSICGHRGDTVEGHRGLQAFFVGVQFPFLFFSFQSFPLGVGLQVQSCQPLLV